jgi:hypothetical protein
MDLYRFVVEEFTIHDTRALHEDSLKLGYSAYVDDDLVASPPVLPLGDFDNGNYRTVEHVPQDDSPGLGPIVINDPTAKVAFMFQLLNAGNAPEGALSGRVAATADQLAGITAGLSGAGATGVFSTPAAALAAGAIDAPAVSSPAFPAGLALEAFANLWAWLDVDCDGPVAFDQISGPRYVLDAWTDNPTESVRTHQNYPGSDSPKGCFGNSNYDVTWSLYHTRTWVPVHTSSDQLLSETGVAAAEHNGAVHAFGVMADGTVNHAQTFTGATWMGVDVLGPYDLTELPVSAVSFNDRLYVFGVQADGSISSLAYTVDGGTWTPHATGPGPLQAAEPAATAVLHHRLYLLARDSASNQLHVTSTSDLDIWDPWANVPSGLPPASAVAAATLNETLFIFGVFKTGKDPDVVIMRNSTSDGSTWSGWETVEAGAGPEGAPADTPLDVAAGIFDGRIYLAARWQTVPHQPPPMTDYLAVNFSEDGENWSGWRTVPTPAIQPSASAGLAAVGNHLYIFAPQFMAPGPGDPLGEDTTTHVWAY